MKPPPILRITFLVFLANIQFSSTALSQSSNLQFFDGVSRDLQVSSQLDSTLSFCVRPNYNANGIYFDSVSNKVVVGRELRSALFLLPIVLQQQYNAHHPYGWNDGSMIPAKGYENQLSLGI